MAELKPLGSEKLNGDDKLKRILELTYYKNANNTQTKSAELVSEAKNGGGVYGIVKERDGYYVKRGLNESSLDYIGGMFMKNKNRFSSYAEALKRLELVKGQEELQEATKYVLKQNKPQEEVPAPSMDAPAPAAEPSTDMPAPDMEAPADEPSSDMPAPDMETTDTEAPSDDMGGEDMGGETSSEGKPSDYMAEVQKFAGKLGQELRDQKEKMESDDIKYVLNMIISAVDLDKLEEEDIEEISKKFERDEDFGDDEEIPSEEPETGDDEEIPAEEPTSDEDIDENQDASMDALEAFINAPVETGEINVASYADIDEDSDDIQEIDMDKIKNEINQSVGETLSKYFK